MDPLARVATCDLLVYRQRVVRAAGSRLANQLRLLKIDACRRSVCAPKLTDCGGATGWGELFRRPPHSSSNPQVQLRHPLQGAEREGAASRSGP